MNAPEGIYWRSEPNWNAAERISGFGVYNGTTIEVHCYQSGTSVPGSADTMWEQATDVAGPGYGSGWLNEHFINDGQPINQPSPGVGPCNPPPPPHEEAPPPPHEEAPPPPHEEPHGGSGLVFSIFNAEGGIYYRNSPHWADTPQTPGVGVYNGDQVQLICGAFGDPVGPFNDTAWSYVTNLSRSVGSGWVDEHFINDGAPDNAFVSGEPMCGPEIPGMSGSRTEATESPASPLPSNPTIPLGSGTQSIFYWPLLKSTEYPPNVPDGTAVGDETLEYSQWAAGNCSTSRAAKLGLPGTVTTLAGWSLSRLAPFYVLATHRKQWGQLRTIILFDPGSASEMSGCDGKIHVDRATTSTATLLREWLQQNKGAELLVLAAEASESDHFHGLWHYYFKQIWNQSLSLRRRVTVCNYNLKHPEVVTDFYQIVKVAGYGGVPSGCPVAAGAIPKAQWNP